MDKIDLRAMAKINLSLDVVRTREDGYHEVRMIMQNVKLCDHIHMNTTKTPGILVKTNLSFLPTGEGNLVYKAADMLIKEFSIERGVFIGLDKHIPVAAGMAGGSSDAAAVLYGMNRLFSLGLSTRDLMERGVKLGADVPFCILRGTALSEGIGEKLTTLPKPPAAHVLIAKPAISISTKAVYEALDSREISEHPDVDGMITAIKAQDLHKMSSLMGNVLECVTENDHEEIRILKSIMKENGALNAMMSGSGPTVFGLFDDSEAADRAYQAVSQSHLAKQLYITEFYNPLRDI